MLARRVFTASDQEWFAQFSGDRNPMHLDPVAARRTLAGGVVVHGVHLALWALDVVAAKPSDLLPNPRIRVSFDAFVGLDQPIELHRRTPTRLDLTTNDKVSATITVAPGSEGAAVPLAGPALDITPPDVPMVNLDFDKLLPFSGRLAFVGRPEPGVPSAFPMARRWLGDGFVTALAATSTLVGMICPGLHSVYKGFAVQATSADPIDSLEFRLTAADPRFRMLRHAVVGGGLSGTVDCFMRAAPTAQMSMCEVREAITPHEFKGSRALVIGGSRGLGELTAKIIAAGDGEVAVTYKVGSADALAVAEDITAGGGACTTLPFDVRKPVAPQLQSLSAPPTHLYYFATPPIFRSVAAAPFWPPRLEEFLQVYVVGFWQVVQHLRIRTPALSIFYPSSIGVAERPKGMTEYAMAKAAAEILCSDTAKIQAPLHVTIARLPRLTTDQTNSLLAVETPASLTTLLPYIREVQSWPEARPK